MDKRICMHCAFASPVLDADVDLICSIDQELVSVDYTCGLFIEEHVFDPSPEFEDIA